MLVFSIDNYRLDTGDMYQRTWFDEVIGMATYKDGEFYRAYGSLIPLKEEWLEEMEEDEC